MESDGVRRASASACLPTTRPDDYRRIAEMLEPPIEAIVIHTSIGEDARRADATPSTPGAASQLFRGRPSASGVAGGGDIGRARPTGRVRARGRRPGTAIEDRCGSQCARRRSRSCPRCRPSGCDGRDHSHVPGRHGRAVPAAAQRLGIETVSRSTWTSSPGSRSGQIKKDRVIAHARAYDHPDAEAVLMPDTALHTVAFLDELRRQSARPC